jgi:hypothetical protein
MPEPGLSTIDRRSMDWVNSLRSPGYLTITQEETGRANRFRRERKNQAGG